VPKTAEIEMARPKSPVPHINHGQSIKDQQFQSNVLMVFVLLATHCFAFKYFSSWYFLTFENLVISAAVLLLAGLLSVVDTDEIILSKFFQLSNQGSHSSVLYKVGFSW